MCFCFVFDWTGIPENHVYTHCLLSFPAEDDLKLLDWMVVSNSVVIMKFITVVHTQKTVMLQGCHQNEFSVAGVQCRERS